MTSNNQEEPTRRKKLYLILGIVAVGFLIGSLAIRHPRASPIAPTGTSSYSTLPVDVPTIQINVPSVQYPTIPPSAPAFTVSLHSIDSSGTTLSGITGTVTFKDIAGTVVILLHVEGLPEEDEEGTIPVELHYGTCIDPGPLASTMTPPDAGESETDLSIDLKQLNTQRPMAVLLYRSAEDHTAIACADIP